MRPVKLALQIVLLVVFAGQALVQSGLAEVSRAEATSAVTAVVVPESDAAAQGLTGQEADCQACRPDPVPPGTDGASPLRANIEDALAEGPVLLFFHSPSCGFCRAQEPIVAELEEQLRGALTVFRLDVFDHPEESAAYGVAALPTLVIIKVSEEAKRIQSELVGLTEKADLLAALGANADETSGDAVRGAE